MKKTFKRAVCCFLAVLMVAFSTPFSVLAANGTYQTEMGNGIYSIGWWGDNNFQAATNDAIPLGEQDYEGWNSETWEYGWNWGDPFAPETDAEQGADALAMFDEYKPVMTVYVSDYSTKGNYFYGYSTSTSTESSYDLEFMEEQGTLLNPADLHEGDVIAVSFEIGGFDELYDGQMKVTFDNEYLQAGYYLGNTFRSVTSTSQAWAKRGSLYYSGVATDASTYVVNQTTGVIYTPFVGDVATPYSVYCGADKRVEEGKFGANGMYIGTATFTVLQDCDLSDVLQWDGVAGDGTPAYSTTNFSPYSPDEVGTERSRYTMATDDDKYTVGLIAVEYYDYDASTSTDTHTHDFTDAEAVSNDDGTHTYTCTAADCDLSEGYQTTENCTYTYEVTTEATYTSAGVGTYTCTECGYSYTETIPALTCAHDGETYVVDAADATCVDEGYTGDTYCSICNQLITAGETIDATGEHTWEVTTEQVDATCTSTGTTAIEKCSVCGATQGGEEIAMTDHVTEIQNAVDATCGTEGYTGDEVCTVCGQTIKAGETIPANGEHVWVEITAQVDATCTSTGTTAIEECSVCGATQGGEEIPATGIHTTEIQNAVDATCTEDGYTGDEVCTVCGQTITTGEVITATDHDYVVTDSKDPSYDEAGYIVYTCSKCDDTYKVTLDKLEGVDITVKAQDLGTVTLNGTDVTNGATITVDKNSTVTLVATPLDGAKFVGWVANDSTTVSTDTTFTPVALADVTYEPVFEIETDNTFTVTFVDSYGNVVYFKTVTDASEIEIPDGPARAGYTFTGWSVDASTVTASTTIVAQYTAAETTGYTVTATGCDITVNGETVTDVATGIAYDTLVTVTYPGAVAWTTPGEEDDVTVGYGESYSFYVGADITLTPVTDSSVVTVAPTVAAVDAYQIDGSYQFSFLATRSMTNDCTYVNAGYIYGLGYLTADDLTLDNVDGSTIRASYCKTSVEQFALNVGIKAQSGSISACAFLAYVDAAGTTQVIYADVQRMSY